MIRLTGNAMMGPDTPVPNKPAGEASSIQSSDQFHDAMCEEDPYTIPQNNSMLSEATFTSAKSESNRAVDGEDNCVKQRPCYKLLKRLSTKRPRIFAITLGLMAPLASLIALALFCGYPLGLLESPIELDQNDFLLEKQMKLLMEASLYTNITQQLPRICLALYFENATAEEFLQNISAILEQPSNRIETYLRMSNNAGVTMEEVLEEAEDDDLNYTSFINHTINETETEVNLATPLLDFVLGGPQISETYDTSVNLTDLSLFLIECGVSLSPILDHMIVKVLNTAHQAIAQLSFAWSRCPTNETGFINDLPPAPTGFLWDVISSIKEPTGWENTWDYFGATPQSLHYRYRWEIDRRRLYHKYLRHAATGDSAPQGLDALVEVEQNETAPTFTQMMWAFELSISEATGRDGCIPHIPAACWFWFTVMTTIGYGNNSPVSEGGKAMVYTLGFLTIILFGGVSARAGYVLTSLLEDFWIRFGLRKHIAKWMEAVIWGGVYYLWMLGIAYYYVWWQEDRLGPDGAISVATGYWFAYISTTSIGFGDYFLAPEAIKIADLIIFPLLFLFGFAFLGAFLTEMSDLLVRPFRSKETLVEQFHKGDERRASTRKRLIASKTTSLKSAHTVP